MKTRAWYQDPLLYAAAAYLLLFFALYGVRFIDVPSLVALFANPFALLPADYQFLHGSPLGPLIGHFLGVRGKYEIYLFFSAAACAALAALGVLAWRAAEPARRPLVFTVLALSPLLHVLLSWVGKSDPLLILGYAAFLLLPESLLISLPAFAMLLAHREQALIILALHLLLFPHEWRRILWALPGAAAALLWFVYYGQVLGGFAGRESALWESTEQLLSAGPIAVLLGVLLIFGWFWLVIAHLLKTHSEKIRIAVAAVAVLALALATVDHTRVGAILGLPLVLFALRAYGAEGQPAPSLRAWIFLAALGLIQLESAGAGVLFSHWLR